MLSISQLRDTDSAQRAARKETKMTQKKEKDGQVAYGRGGLLHAAEIVRGINADTRNIRLMPCGINTAEYIAELIIETACRTPRERGRRDGE